MLNTIGYDWKVYVKRRKSMQEAVETEDIACKS